MSDLQGRVVLAIFAHPDDESLACGGTLARLADLGARVVVCCATHGERGAATGPARDDALGRVRAREIRVAAEALGIADVLLLDHPDGDLRWAQIAEFSADIRFAIERYRPAAVVTFGQDGLYWHADHIAVHERTTTVLRGLGRLAPPLYYVTMRRGSMSGVVTAAANSGWRPPPKGFWSLVPDAFGLHADPPEFVVNVQPWVARKLAAIRSHATQIGDDSPLARIAVDDAARWLGQEYFHRAAGIASGAQALESLGTPP